MPDKYLLAHADWFPEFNLPPAARNRTRILIFQTKSCIGCFPSAPRCCWCGRTSCASVRTTAVATEQWLWNTSHCTRMYISISLFITVWYVSMYIYICIYYDVICVIMSNRFCLVKWRGVLGRTPVGENMISFRLQDVVGTPRERGRQNKIREWKTR